ncbi:MAG: hypothetical protein LBV60_00745, partial [Streptomyces sp.]|nr:hypothetical protein [Streptomyces sp.]
PGLNLAFNGTGRPEPVLTSGQWRAIQGAGLGGGGAQTPVVVELHPKAGTLSDFIDVRVQDHQQQLIQVINAG